MRFIENTIHFFLVLELLATVFSLPDVTARLSKSACALPKALWHGLVPCRRRGREPGALGKAGVLEMPCLSSAREHAPGGLGSGSCSGRESSGSRSRSQGQAPCDKFFQSGHLLIQRFVCIQHIIIPCALPLPGPLPLGEGAWPSASPLIPSSLREKAAAGRMRVKTLG